MAGKGLSLTLAIDNYDRHMPLFTGAVGFEGIDATLMEVGQSAELRHGRFRHERMFQGEFDAAELSLCSYLIARDQGRPMMALPIFPRRLFSLSLIYCNSEAGIRTPKDLEGKRVGVTSYQVTLGVLARGDLAHEYGVDWKSITWVTGRDEAIPVSLPPEIKVEHAGPGKDLGDMLSRGEIQGLAMPHPPRRVLEGDPNIEPLFEHQRGEDLRYYNKNGYYPIMHVISIREPLLHQHPWLAQSLREAFDKSFAVSRSYYDDPNWSSLAWGRTYVEEERALFKGDPWQHGLAANRANLERFVQYVHEQGLISRRPALEEIFVTK